MKAAEDGGEPDVLERVPFRAGGGRIKHPKSLKIAANPWQIRVII
jgi:hypothetical protein